MSDSSKAKAVTEQWHDLAKEAEQRHGISLHDDIESYLLFALTKYPDQPDEAVKVMAQDYLHSAQQTAAMHKEGSRDAGIPRLLIISYFMELARDVYHTIIAATQRMLSANYNQHRKE